MTRYFADTWFLIAYVNRGDSDHRRVDRLWRVLDPSHFVTHDGVLAEFLTFFSEFGPMWRQKAANTVRTLATQGVEVVPQDRKLFLKALAFYEERLDKGYSLADCMSMVLMREQGITQVLTNDHHFRQEGFTTLSDAP